MKTVLSVAKFLLEKCVGCKTCLHVCPTKAYTPSLNRPLEKLKISPCAAACPIGNDIEGFVALVGQQCYAEAYDLLLQTNPFPGTTGRVCHHPCEQQCNRARFDGEVSIQSLERFVAGYAREKGYTPKKPEMNRAESVAVIGAGPAGLSCAFHLARSGYRVTVFEADGEPGGMLRHGIPKYRLPKEILDWEISNLASLDVEIRCNRKLGKNLQIDDLKDFNAVFVAVGLQKPHRLMIPGEDLPGVYPALDLLAAVNAGREINLGPRVAVIGGGNAAVDAARCALRLGSRPFILYRRSIAEMPALEAERQELAREGVEVIPFVLPTGFVSVGGKLSQIKCLKTRPVDVEKDGRRRPVPVEGSEFAIDIDTVVVAIGESPDVSTLGLSLGETEGRFTAEPDGVIKRERIFAGGDVATGKGTVSEAIASGKNGALAIHRFIQNGIEEKPAVKPEAVGFDEMNSDYFYAAPRVTAGHLDVERSVRSFEETCLGYSEAQAVKESGRCFGCAAPPTYTVADCRGCVNCVERCPAGAIVKEPLAEPFTVGVDPREFDPDEIMRICRNVKLHPQQVICYCTDTRAGEVAAAILKGAKTPEDVSKTTGARTGCSVLCIQSIIKLLESGGHPVALGDTHQCYGKTFTVWDMDSDTQTRLESRGYHFEADMELIEKVFENK